MQNQFKKFKYDLKKIAASDLGLEKAFNCLINNLDYDSGNFNTATFLIKRYNNFKYDSIIGKTTKDEEKIVPMRLINSFCEFIDLVEEPDFYSFDISKTGSRLQRNKRKSKEQKSRFKSWKKYYWWLIPLILIPSLILGWQHLKSDSNNKIETDFNLLFRKGEVLPFLKNPDLPCFDYEGKWELDQKKPYVLSIDLGTGYGNYYYKAKSLHLYTWCDTNNYIDTIIVCNDTIINCKDKGYKLKGIEIFTNELWKDTKNRNTVFNVDSLNIISEDNGYIKIANISSLFTDEIELSEDGLPKKRTGEKIIRYQPTEVMRGNEKLVRNVIETYLGKLYRTSCSSVTNYGEPGISDQTIMQFDCKFESIKGENDYKKRIIFKGPVKHL